MSSKSILIRNFVYQESYAIWLKNKMNTDIEFLRSTYEEYLLNDQTLGVFMAKGEGFEAMLWQNLADHEVNVSFVLDYFRQKIIPLGYYAYMSDQKEQVMDGGERLLFERHYLKPTINLNSIDSQNRNQHYGNITLENCIQSKQGKQLKIMSGRYPNRTYLSFHQLVALLLN